MSDARVEVNRCWEGGQVGWGRCVHCVRVERTGSALRAARLPQRMTVCRSNPRHCRKDSPEGFGRPNSRLEHVVCDHLDLKHSEMREMPPGLGRTRCFSEAPWAGSTLNGGCLDSGQLAWAQGGEPHRIEWPVVQILRGFRP